MRRMMAFACAATALAAAGGAILWGAPKPPPTPEELAAREEKKKKQMEDELKKVEAALPDKPAVAPQKPRKLFIFTGSKGFHHDSIPLGAETLKLLGAKTGAYQSVISNDPQMFAADKLKEFDAVFLDNTTGVWFAEDSLKQSLLDFVKGGKGVAGNHGATDAFYQKWPEYGELIGGFFAGHPFGSITVKLDDPASPINAVFKGQGFAIRDEIYIFKEPYSREKLHILLSIDNEKTFKGEPKKNRPDADYALSWIRDYGQGRVFYCAFGHAHEIFWNPAILQHVLAGIQYALGDLKADAAPSVKK
jgi:type 1 glutamine amidotransferase